MSMKETYDLVDKKLKEQNKDIKVELEKIMNEGRCKTRAAGLNVLAMELEVERTPITISGYYLKKLKDRFGKEKTFIYGKDSGIMQVRNVMKDYDPFTPVVFEKVDKCLNIRTKGEWLEANDNTVMNSTGDPDIRNVIKDATSFDAVNEQDYYLVYGAVKYVNAAPIFAKPANPGEKPAKPTSQKPIFEQSEKDGDKLNIKITLVDSNQKSINLTVQKLAHLVNAYPMQTEPDYLKWFTEEADDDQRLFELQKGLASSRLLVMGRGSRYIEKKDEPKEDRETLKKPFLIVGNDGLLFNIEQYGIDDIPMEAPSLAATAKSEPKPQPQTTFTQPTTVAFVPTVTTSVSPPVDTNPVPVTQPTTPQIDLRAEVLNFIKLGKGTKRELMVDLPLKLGLKDGSPVVQTIKELSTKGEIFREGNGEAAVFKATAGLP